VDVRKTRIDLCPLLAATVEAVRPSCDARTIELTAVLPQGPVPIDADAARLTQVVSNLLNNAAKFTEPGGRIALSLECAGDAAIVRVADTGIGIAANQLARVFDMFMQVDPSLERSRTGLGLGLTLVKQLVEAHGGSVSASSGGLGLGSEFVLHLPLPAEAVPVEAPVPAATAAPPTTPPRRVLIVEDNADGARSLAMVIGLRGHDVRTAPDGPPALALAESWQPEVVVLIALSGWGQGDNQALATQAGFDAHLLKPADLDVLIGMVDAPLAPH
jgi:hypothetical protein